MVTTNLTGFMTCTFLAILAASQATFDVYYVKPSHNSSPPYACPASSTQHIKTHISQENFIFTNSQNQAF